MTKLNEKKTLSKSKQTTELASKNNDQRFQPSVPSRTTRKTHSSLFSNLGGALGAFGVHAQLHRIESTLVRTSPVLSPCRFEFQM
jgi:hypothetical protein